MNVCVCLIKRVCFGFCFGFFGASFLVVVCVIAFLEGKMANVWVCEKRLDVGRREREGGRERERERGRERGRVTQRRVSER